MNHHNKWTGQIMRFTLSRLAFVGVTPFFASCNTTPATIAELQTPKSAFERPAVTYGRQCVDVFGHLYGTSDYNSCIEMLEEKSGVPLELSEPKMEFER